MIAHSSQSLKSTVASSPKVCEISKSRQRGFTLIELLSVILIIAILASLTSVVMMEAVEDARRSRTRAQVSRINQLIMTKWEELEYRQLPIRYMDPSVPIGNPNGATITGIEPKYAAKARLYSLRQFMRLEFPDRLTDIIDGWVPIPIFAEGDFDSDGDFEEVQTPPALVTWIDGSQPSIHRRFQNQIPASATTELQGAECLYMILASIDDERGTGLDYFSDDEIGDIDGDGLNEILDAWGRPIEFIRWPAGFRSPMQQVVLYDFYDAEVNQGITIVQHLTNQGRRPFDPDSFDFVESDPRRLLTDSSQYAFNFQPYLIYPLIYSAGADGVYDVVKDLEWNYGNGLVPFRYSQMHQYPGDSIAHPPNDPFFRVNEFRPNHYYPVQGVDGGQMLQIGTLFHGVPNVEDGDDDVGEYFDNITNQTQSIDE